MSSKYRAILFLPVFNDDKTCQDYFYEFASIDEMRCITEKNSANKSSNKPNCFY